MTYISKYATINDTKNYYQLEIKEESHELRLCLVLYMLLQVFWYCYLQDLFMPGLRYQNP